jgi:hypothetical protein
MNGIVQQFMNLALSQNGVMPVHIGGLAAMSAPSSSSIKSNTRGCGNNSSQASVSNLLMAGLMIGTPSGDTRKTPRLNKPSKTTVSFPFVHR